MLLEFYYPYFPLATEAFKLNIPIIGSLSFTTLNTNKKCLYPLLTTAVDSSKNKIFYTELIIYLINLCNPINFLYSSTLTKVTSTPKSFLVTEAISSSYIDYVYGNNHHPEQSIDLESQEFDFELDCFTKKTKNKITSNLWGFTFARRRFKIFKIQLFEFNRNKKWQWYRKKKFKVISKYVRNFISKGKFKPLFGKFKLRYMLLKRLFCNLFDLQYNYKT